MDKLINLDERNNAMRVESAIRLYIAHHKKIINWTCPICTYINTSYETDCEMCDTKRDIPKDNQTTK